MPRSDPLCREYLRRYPADAARVLEGLDTAGVTLLLDRLDPEDAAQALGAMQAEPAARCLTQLDPARAAAIIGEMESSRLNRVLPLIQRDALELIRQKLPLRLHLRLRAMRRFADQTAGGLMDARALLLSDQLTVGNALRRIERRTDVTDGEYLVVDGAQHPLGRVRLVELIATPLHTPLIRLLHDGPPPLPSGLPVQQALEHDWHGARIAAVIDPHGAALGCLRREALLEAARTSEKPEPGSGMEAALSLAGLYWLTVAEFIEALTSGREGPARGASANPKEVPR